MSALLEWLDHRVRMAMSPAYTIADYHRLIAEANMTSTPDWADEIAFNVLLHEPQPCDIVGKTASALRAAFLRGRVAELRKAVQIAMKWADENGQHRYAAFQISDDLRDQADKLEKGEA